MDIILFISIIINICITNLLMFKAIKIMFILKNLQFIDITNKFKKTKIIHHIILLFLIIINIIEIYRML